MFRLSLSARRHDGVGGKLGAAARVLGWLLEPLLPLLTCALLALLSASLAAAMRHAEPEGPLLADNGSLVNFTWPRHPLHLMQPPLAAAVDSAIAAAEPPATGCPELNNATVERLCTDLAEGRLQSLAVPKAAHHLRHCDVFDFRHLIVHADSLVRASAEQHNCSLLLLAPHEREGVPVNRSRCSACLKALIAADDHVKGMTKLFTDLLDKYQCTIEVKALTNTNNSLRSTDSSSSSSSSASPSSSPLRSNASKRGEPMTPQTNMGASNCEACKVAYRGWLCTRNFTIYPFSTVTEMPLSQRFMPQPACSNWCAAVETNCPYFTPGEDQQNGGEPVFLCDEAHYHHSSHYRVPSDPCEQDSRRHSCCFTQQDTNCRLPNKTCPSLQQVCFASLQTSVEAVTAAANTSLNTSTSPSAPQQQYFAQPQNATLEKDNATSPDLAASGPTRTICAPLLLLTAFLILPSCQRQLT